jgi:antirestriction protein ArdC
MRTDEIVKKINQQILEAIKEGTIPWRKRWLSLNLKNGVTDYEYHGINIFILAMQGYSDPRWLTFNQVKKIHGHVLAKAKGTTIIFWKPIEIKKDDKKEIIPLLESYTVFNVKQCEVDYQLLKPIEESAIEKNTNAEALISNYKDCPEIRTANEGYYAPVEDYIGMPPINRFTSQDAYYEALFHELIHSTGNEKRLNRCISDKRPSKEEYSREEMIAEMGASYLLELAEIPFPIKMAADYINGWSTAVKEDKYLFIKSASQAERALRYILEGNTKQ